MRHILAACLLAATLALPAAAAPGPADQQAVHVLNRIGYGPRPGDIERVTALGVTRYIEEQLNPEAIPLPPALSARLALLDAANAPAAEALARYLDLRRDARNEEEGARQQRKAAMQKANRETDAARLLRAIESPRQLEEVLVEFWFNHFNVYSGKGLDRALVASYERDAIRPYVLGSFRDLLGATAKHPAMLFYLDNHLSTAAGFVPKGKNNNGMPRGLNENYARELMELHTLGVDAGYTQRDVTELARMLTGWTFTPRDLSGPNDGFRFDRRRHDHGTKHWLGQVVEDQGQAEGEYALDVLAMHPNTARHVSYQLAQYFVQDVPPPALVERMAATWQASRGSLRAVMRTLLTSDEFMAAATQGSKFKTPYQFVVSAVRASGVQVQNVQPLVGALNQLGMPLYGCQTPDGYKNTQEAWLNPNALTRRIAFATALGTGKLALDRAPAAPVATTLRDGMAAPMPAVLS
ncbi:DUF1800 domain-containing protein, partial [Massilia arenosa]